MSAPRIPRQSLTGPQAALALIGLLLLIGALAIGMLEWRVLVYFCGWMLGP
jgi:type IV secretory pathway VirB2 component (pilin)